MVGKRLEERRRKGSRHEISIHTFIVIDEVNVGIHVCVLQGGQR